MEESPEIPLPHENNIPPFGHEETWEDVMISDDLTEGARWGIYYTSILMCFRKNQT